MVAKVANLVGVPELADHERGGENEGHERRHGAVTRRREREHARRGERGDDHAEPLHGGRHRQGRAG